MEYSSNHPAHTGIHAAVEGCPEFSSPASGSRAKPSKGMGRYLPRTDHRTGTTYVSWVRPGDDWTTQSQRFHRACMKGYVGKYASRYEGLKPARLATGLPRRSSSSQREEEPGHSAATL